MNRIKNMIILLLAATLMAACSAGNERDADEIAAAEDALFAEDKGITDKTKALELVNMYVAFAEEYPEDSMAVEYLFKWAEFYLNLGEGERSIELYDRVIQEYPDFRKVPECIFLKAYVYENYMGDLESARAYYSEFLGKYPDNEFADDARISIQNLGKSPEELIQQFEEQQSISKPEYADGSSISNVVL